MSFVLNTLALVLRSTLALVLRTLHFGAFTTAALAGLWYFLVGTQWIEYASAFGLAIAGMCVAVSMVWEAFRLALTSMDYEAAKKYAYQSGHIWAFRKAADLAIPLLVAIDSVDFGVAQWNSDWAQLERDNIQSQIRRLRNLANNSDY